jgi:hypothetical protein
MNSTALATAATNRVPTSRRTELFVSAQNEWYTQPISCATAGPDSAIAIGGSFFLSIGAFDTPDLDAFLSKGQSQVEARLQRFLDRHPSVDGETSGMVIMDIERPHPRDLHLYSPALQERIVRAMAIRVAATRARFPHAALGLYGTLVPDGRGRAGDATYRARKKALVHAGRRGMFDQVDFLVPVLYPRFGPTDRSWDTYDAYTRLGVTGSRSLRTSDHRRLPVVPLLTYSVANGNSNHHQQLLLDLPTHDPLEATLGTQLEVLAEEDVSRAIFWVGENSDLIARLPNPNSRTVTQHLCRALRSRPPAG